jgi:hypothetical protein
MCLATGIVASLLYRIAPFVVDRIGQLVRDIGASTRLLAGIDAWCRAAMSASPPAATA